MLQVGAVGVDHLQAVGAQQSLVAVEGAQLLLQQLLGGLARLHFGVELDLAQQVIVGQLVGLAGVGGRRLDQAAGLELVEHGRQHFGRHPALGQLGRQLDPRAHQPLLLRRDQRLQHAPGRGALLGQQVAAEHALQVAAQDAGHAALALVDRAGQAGFARRQLGKQRAAHQLQLGWGDLAALAVAQVVQQGLAPARPRR